MARYAKPVASEARVSAFFDAEGLNFPNAVASALGRDVFTGNYNLTTTLLKYIQTVYAKKLSDKKPLAAFPQAVYNLFARVDFEPRAALTELKVKKCRDKTEGFTSEQSINKSGENVLKLLKQEAQAITEARRKEKLAAEALLKERIETAQAQLSAVNAASAGQRRAEGGQARLDEVNALTGTTQAVIDAVIVPETVVTIAAPCEPVAVIEGEVMEITPALSALTAPTPTKTPKATTKTAPKQRKAKVAVNP